MSKIFYDNKTEKELDSYYGLDLDVIKGSFKETLEEESKFIQKAFEKHGLNLTLSECKNLYEIYSDKYFSSSWTGSVFDYGTDEEAKDELFKNLHPFLEIVLIDRYNRLTSLLRKSSKIKTSNLKISN